MLPVGIVGVTAKVTTAPTVGLLELAEIVTVGCSRPPTNTTVVADAVPPPESRTVAVAVYVPAVE